MAMNPRFAEALTALGIELDVRDMDESTHTAQQAADAFRVPVGTIVKSLLFVADDAPLLLLVSGPNRVDTAAVAERLGSSVAMADAKLVKTATGYSIGGVPPFGHPEPLRTIMDPDLLDFDEVWAAAGSATTVFGIAPERLQELTRAEVVPVTATAAAP